MSTLRTLLILGRVSNLPTVWSNCMAGWWLGGGGDARSLVLLCLAATSLYVGGMYLNDAFDAPFDQQHRPERPIPSGSIRVETVWLLGFCWLILGLGGAWFLGRNAFVCAVLLTGAILVYDAVHKIFAFSPVLMAFCRFLLILFAAVAGDQGITGLAVWSALVMGSYIVGLSYVAKTESTLMTLRYWPCLFLAAPLVLGMVVNWGSGQFRFVVVLLVFIAIWIVHSLRFALWSAQRNIGRCVSGLLAGIPLLDLLSIWEGQALLLAAIFVGLFLVALLFQRFIPAT